MLNSSLQERKHDRVPHLTHTSSTTLLHAAISKKKKKKRKSSFTYPSSNPLMTSFLSLPFRINDMPCGIMGRVSESYLVTTDLGWISNHSGLKADPAYLYSKRMTLYQSKKPSIERLMSWFLLQTAKPSQHYYFLYVVVTLAAAVWRGIQAHACSSSSQMSKTIKTRCELLSNGWLLVKMVSMWE